MKGEGSGFRFEESGLRVAGEKVRCTDGSQPEDEVGTDGPVPASTQFQHAVPSYTTRWATTLLSKSPFAQHR